MSMKNSFTQSHAWQRLMAFFLIFVMVFGSQGASKVQASSSETPLAIPLYTLHLNVISANDSNDAAGTYNISKGDPITDFKYIINLDNTGTTEQRDAEPGSGCSPLDAGYPDSCNWVSVAGRAAHKR